MKKIFAIALLLVISVTLTGCTNPFAKNIGKSSTTGSATEISGKMKDILASGKNVKCDYIMSTATEKGFGIKGTVYISGKKSRSDIIMTADGKENVSHYLTDAEWMYMWGDDKQGTKINIAEMQKITEKLKETNPESAKKQEETANLGIDDKAELKCSIWVPNNSLLTPPTDVQFTDTTETMKNLTETLKKATEKVDDLKKAGCSACNMAPDDKTKSECKAQLGCTN